MNVDTTKLETVPTNTLAVGDVILCHGGIFRVFEVKVSQAHDNTGPGGECHANYCEFLGNVHDDYECAIPKHWRDGRPDTRNPGRTFHWCQQGNGLARTTRVKA